MRIILIIILLMPFIVLAESINQHFGWVEHAAVGSMALNVKVKLDTGAKTSSLDAHEIRQDLVNGQKWVHFTIKPDNRQAIKMHLPLVRISKIRKRSVAKKLTGSDFSLRPVVQIPICMGDKRISVEVNLTDRSHFIYPLLLGRSALRLFNAVIDPRLTYTHPLRCPA